VSAMASIVFFFHAPFPIGAVPPSLSRYPFNIDFLPPP
jgi:hypothetical protein